ncbi:FtsX-like permease family protein [Jidongwangia harbinensis]|uniref:FtsX-like permease family protein n=1 Tax=Jidongwangia harbinensis TaxID=2878561 RepID=UPI001CDA3327|nr:FtsX-like permease family protein [Jidongwangia harbinensis]MCA2218084.1 permease [Jidongwangia harbinensis]
MRPSTVLRLALAGSRTDRLRTVLTAASSALAAIALLAAVTVGSITTNDPNGPYTSQLLNEAGLRPGVLAALILLSIPVLGLAGQCIRLGAPARDRRLAALRLAGATPRQAVLVASAETALAGLVGSITGYGLFLALRAMLHRPDAAGLLPLPTDVWPAVLPAVLVLAAVPLVAAAVGTLLLRRVVISPLGVVRRSREQAPRPWPGVLIAVGLALFGIPNWLGDDVRIADEVLLLLLGSGVTVATVGVILGTGWISHVSGRLLLRLGRRPALLLAGRRLLSDPWNGSRTFAGLLAGVIAGAFAIGYRAMLSTEMLAYDRINAGAPGGLEMGLAGDDEFYLNAVRLVIVAVAVGVTVAAGGMLIALAESIVARRRAYAALTAVGVPRRVLSEAVLWHTVAPLVPALLVALTVGVGLVRLIATEIRLSGGEADVCLGETCGPDAALTHVVWPEVVLPVPVPLADLAVLGGGVLLAMLAVVGAGLLVLRSSTDLEELRAG